MCALGIYHILVSAVGADKIASDEVLDDVGYGVLVAAYRQGCLCPLQADAVVVIHVSENVSDDSCFGTFGPKEKTKKVNVIDLNEKWYFHF